jgi:hypothetical protein
MRIIKQGVEPGTRRWRGRCVRCGAIVEAEEQELHVTHDQLDGTTARATCPSCCKSEIYFNRVKEGG